MDPNLPFCYPSISQIMKDNRIPSVKRDVNGRVIDRSVDSRDELNLGFDHICELDNIPPSFSLTVSQCDDEHGRNGFGLELRRNIMVGASYQVKIPKWQSANSAASDNYEEGQDKCVWKPDAIPSQKVDDYLAKCHEIRNNARGSETDTVVDNEQALQILFGAEYNVERALEKFRSMQQAEPEQSVPWTEEECANFESGVREYGKNFALIQLNKVTTRSLGEVIQFYYLWKKSSRYEDFGRSEASRLAQRRRQQDVRRVLYDAVFDGHFPLYNSSAFHHSEGNSGSSAAFVLGNQNVG